ncbi:hypothetical protein CBR_g44401 [Chara braunii]|uniref:Strictosidine synthase conserved region domain-containing protein n=1 Tax=Chara braunii TaxID=69332 RepID=A0A388LXA1_CHABU|nr:hypothetical protein CBR_g44401 [Chara braunii]|eukprot:GBG86948.1 hypothetical protein CBR_g44401 [Chara braunii]
MAMAVTFAATIAVAMVAMAAVWFQFYVPVPTGFDPVGQKHAPPPSMEGAVFTPNEELKRAEKLGIEHVSGPEDLVADSSGRLYFGSAINGYIQRMEPDGQVDDWADVGGRALGLEWGPNGDLLACVQNVGLVAVTVTGEVRLLLDSVDNASLPTPFFNNLDVSSESRLYVSESSTRWPLEKFVYSMLEGVPSGRLIEYDILSNASKILMDGLDFANGVAISKDEDFLIIAETGMFRLHRYWLKGPKAGTHEVFLDNLPGYADNIHSNRKGLFWIAIPVMRSPASETFVLRYRFMRWLVASFPPLWTFFLRNNPGFALAVNEDGKPVMAVMNWSKDHLRMVTTAREYGGYLYLGNLMWNYLAKFKLTT